LTPAQLREAAEAARAEAQQLERQALALREQARLLDETADKAPLTIGRERSIVGSKVEANVSGRDRYVRQAASRTRRTSEAKKLLLEAGMTDSKVADLLGVGRSTVNAWFGGKRPIPAAHAAKLEKLHAVPLSAWPRIN
jgi:hypothetical protein